MASDRAEREIRNAARAHAKAMMALYGSVNQVAKTAGVLVGVMQNWAPDPGVLHPLYVKADTAMGTLQAAYGAVAAVFDDLPDGGPGDRE